MERYHLYYNCSTVTDEFKANTIVVFSNQNILSFSNTPDWATSNKKLILLIVRVFFQRGYDKMLLYFFHCIHINTLTDSHYSCLYGNIFFLVFFLTNHIEERQWVSSVLHRYLVIFIFVINHPTVETALSFDCKAF